MNKNIPKHDHNINSFFKDGVNLSLNCGFLETSIDNDRVAKMNQIQIVSTGQLINRINDIPTTIASPNAILKMIRNACHFGKLFK